MSFVETTALGALAGLTIYLGLPLGRMKTVSQRSRVALAMFSVGILAFIFVDVLQHSLAILHDSVDRLRHGGSLGDTVGLTVLLAGGFLAGSAGLAVVERRLRPAPRVLPPIAGGASASPVATSPLGSSPASPVASGPLDPSQARLIAEADLARRATLQRGLTIAVAIGLHNFAEGLAIGVSARAGAIGLATVLIIGFALHNATEGFGIVGPLGDVRPSWAWLGLAGLIGGGPTLAGAMVGYNVTSEALELAFYALAGGAILYVIGEVWQAMRRYGHRELGLCLLGMGFITGVVTDLVVTYGGG